MSNKPYTAWLLETEGVGINKGVTVYYKKYVRPIDGGRDDLHTANPDVTQAMQFKTKKEAIDYAEIYGLSLTAREHMFNCGATKRKVIK